MTSAQVIAPRKFPPWGDKEIARFQFRTALFRRRGIPEGYADELADRLFERDFEGDDRRMCLECKHLQRTGACFAAAQGWMPANFSRRHEPVRDLLQRCECFDWQKPA